MFYGRGAGAGATASAVVADVVGAIVGGGCDVSFEKSDSFADFNSFRSKKYIALDCDVHTARQLLSDVNFIDTDECAFITDEITEYETDQLIDSLKARSISARSIIRIL
jgi:hypothetical protein